MRKKILLLGGSYGQLPAIHEAKARGLYTVLCDYLPDNPGAELVDEFHLISTTNKEEVLNLAQLKNIDFVLAFASDPATPTAAFVSENMGLPGNTLSSIRLLSEKDQFRAFQKRLGYNTPKFTTIGQTKPFDHSQFDVPFPAVVKPVDSSDTKGVRKINSIDELENAVNDAMRFSRANKAIVEEFIDDQVADLHGDAFFLNGKMVFSMLGDRIFSSLSNPLKPSTELYPSRLPQQLIQEVENEVAGIVEKSGFKNGAVNVESRINKHGKNYILEIGPRSGGTLTPQTIAYSCGFDMLKATFDFFQLGEANVQLKEITPSICFALHVNRGGRLKEIKFDPSVEKYIIEKHIYVKPGDHILPYSSPGSTIGTLILSFADFDEVNSVIDSLYEKVTAGVVME